jgi:ubiquinol-cytochrome c reductase iron-sulfur subunit
VIFFISQLEPWALLASALPSWPLIHQMNPDAGVQALASIEVNLDAIVEGQSVTVMWRGKPVFVRHRTADEIERSRADRRSGRAA